MLKGSLNSTNRRQNIKRLAYVPTLDELNVNMVQALKFRGRTEELSWVDPDSGIEYKLQCLCRLSDTSSPIWELLMLRDGLWQVILRHESTDTILMFNSVMNAIGRKENNAQSDGAMYANSARYNEGDKISDSFRHFATSTKLRKTDVDAMGALLEPDPELGEAQMAPEPPLPVFEQISEQKLIACFQALLNYGLQPDSVLVKNDASIPLAKISKKLAGGLPVDLEPQIKLYSAIDGRLSMNELILSFNWGRKQWVPIVWNLVNCNLVSIAGSGAPVSEPPAPEPIKAPRTAATSYRAAIDRIKHGLLNPASGLYSFDAMLFFLEYEGKRVRRNRHAVTLFVFKPNLMHQGVQQLVAQGVPLDPLIVKAVDQVKRSDEILAHFDTGCYAIVMPSTRQSGASQAIHRFLKHLTKTGLGPDPNSGAPPICIAVVSMPDHASNLVELISAAKAELTRVESLCAVAL